jgi:hypothetical protein
LPAADDLFERGVVFVVEVRVLVGGFGVRFGFKAALSFIVGVVGGGAFLFLEDREVFQWAGEDLNFARGCDVTDATGLLWSHCGSCFADRHRVFKNDAMAREVAPRISNEVESEGFLATGDVEYAGGAAGVAAVNFAVENLGGEAECQGSGLAGLDGKSLGFAIAACWAWYGDHAGGGKVSDQCHGGQ